MCPTKVTTWGTECWNINISFGRLDHSLTHSIIFIYSQNFDIVPHFWNFPKDSVMYFVNKDYFRGFKYIIYILIESIPLVRKMLDIVYIYTNYTFRNMEK